MIAAGYPFEVILLPSTYKHTLSQEQEIALDLIFGQSERENEILIKNNGLYEVPFLSARSS